MSFHRAFPDPPPSHPPRGAEAPFPNPASSNPPFPNPPFPDAPFPDAPFRQAPAAHWSRGPHEPHPPRDDLGALRSGYQGLRRVATLTALGYFLVFLLLAAFAPGLMTGEITGGLTTGLVLGLCQLPVALAAIAVYERTARHRVDPLAAAVRERTPRGDRRWSGRQAGGDRS